MGSENYPPSLEILVTGVTVNNDQTGRKLKFLRRIPEDPMTNSKDWGMRSYTDRPIAEGDRLYHWPQGRRPDSHAGSSELGL